MVDGSFPQLHNAEPWASKLFKLSVTAKHTNTPSMTTTLPVSQYKVRTHSEVRSSHEILVGSIVFIHVGLS